MDREANPIDIPVVKRAMVYVLVTQRGNLADRFEGLTTVQRKFVQTLAGMPTRHFDSKTFLESADLAKSSAPRARARCSRSRSTSSGTRGLGGASRTPSSSAT